jgi:Arc/MetJ family transcription regulator
VCDWCDRTSTTEDTEAIFLGGLGDLRGAPLDQAGTDCLVARGLTDTHTSPILTHTTMRTNIDIDDGLMARALRASGKATKRAVVEEALHLLVRTKRQTRIRRWRGKVAWEGDLEKSRASRLLE